MTSNPKKRTLLARMLLALGAVIFALIVMELALRMVNQPRFLKAHEETPRFAPTHAQAPGDLLYVNYPGRITFTYDGNPRDYFGLLNEVHHDVNPSGFRGSAFTRKPMGVRRLVFLGDSFTFGEGVRNEDTYAEVTARLLWSDQQRVESCNLGVGGYNTTQALQALTSIGFSLTPDAVVLGYVPNDAEPPLFALNPVTGQPVRRNREADIESEGIPARPPHTGLYKFRLAQLIWQSRTRSRLAQQTVAYYNELFEEEQPGWQESRRALQAIISACAEKKIPCVVVMFPVLYNLGDNYPFTGIHEKVGKTVRDAGGIFVDLLPMLKGKHAPDLWVHPTDQHPNEIVHRIAAEQIARAIEKNALGPRETRGKPRRPGATPESRGPDPGPA